MEKRLYKPPETCCDGKMGRVVMDQELRKETKLQELRGFGKGKKRTWYSGRPFSKLDLVAMGLCVLLMLLSLGLIACNGNRYFDPFV